MSFGNGEWGIEKKYVNRQIKRQSVEVQHGNDVAPASRNLETCENSKGERELALCMNGKFGSPARAL